MSSRCRPSVLITTDDDGTTATADDDDGQPATAQVHVLHTAAGGRPARAGRGPAGGSRRRTAAARPTGAATVFAVVFDGGRQTAETGGRRRTGPVRVRPGPVAGRPAVAPPPAARVAVVQPAELAAVVHPAAVVPETRTEFVHHNHHGRPVAVVQGVRAAPDQLRGQFVVRGRHERRPAGQQVATDHCHRRVAGRVLPQT